MVSADGTVVDDDIPGPEGDSVPLDDGLASCHDGSQGYRHTFFTSNFFFSLPDSLDTALPLDELAEESFISTSVMVLRRVYVFDWRMGGCGPIDGREREDRWEDLARKSCRSR